MARGTEPGKPSGAGRDADHKPVSGELDQRLNRLEVELTKKGAFKTPASEEERSGTSGSVAQAMKLSSEFIAGIVVGALIGWFLDRFVGTSPWGLIVFLLLGFGAGTLNVLRSSGYIAEQGNIKSDGEKRGKE
ncbi:AtpZ/AtpI family protein [Falsochrobactrum sp. TDYN1]|uniref:ATP synthase protein I n=1 Tax=Falsochrobactrum tianjinense TaxID=2706015 RepID=A0A949PK40_9HYPH|nr:AtpZ/AtpI family protein [Falsochrobactrum sp. TDYN1]MBV2142491.1 AtpZ/AtpI family protein [Falsochrobactrum sp. TDYN1]